MWLNIKFTQNHKLDGFLIDASNSSSIYLKISWKRQTVKIKGEYDMSVFRYSCVLGMILWYLVLDESHFRRIKKAIFYVLISKLPFYIYYIIALYIEDQLRQNFKE